MQKVPDRNLMKERTSISICVQKDTLTETQTAAVILATQRVKRTEAQKTATGSRQQSLRNRHFHLKAITGQAKEQNRKTAD